MTRLLYSLHLFFCHMHKTRLWCVAHMYILFGSFWKHSLCFVWTISWLTLFWLHAEKNIRLSQFSAFSFNKYGIYYIIYYMWGIIDAYCNILKLATYMVSWINILLWVTQSIIQSWKVWRGEGENFITRCGKNTWVSAQWYQDLCMNSFTQDTRVPMFADKSCTFWCCSWCFLWFLHQIMINRQSND